MLAIERRNAILAKLNSQGKVIVTDLSREFNVTEETIRRDLEKLDNEGLATKTYGGAVANQNFNVDLPYNVRKRANVERKQKMAEIAEIIKETVMAYIDKPIAKVGFSHHIVGGYNFANAIVDWDCC